LVNIGKGQDYLFSTNFIKTSKYEIYNFPAKFLLEEFNPGTKIANCYFLLIAALQCIPEISNTGGYPTTLLPLMFVVAVDAFFQIVEDLARHKSDREANAAVAHKFDMIEERFVDVQRHELAVGDFVKVNSRETIPADVVCLGVAEKSNPPKGICYIETKSLDGETNLKIRNALPSTLAMMSHETSLPNLKGHIEMEHPNKLIDSFSGVVDIEGVGREPIHATNILLRGCALRNTDFILGVVVNTGSDTKIMMSNTVTRSKTSSLETESSSQIKSIIILLALLCFWGATGMSVWNSFVNVGNVWYLHWHPQPVGYWFIKFFYFFLLHATYIPVSLYVSMATVRFFQSYFINNDLEMYYESTDTPALARTMTLNEELGQISHIFSDKTGTLTCNVMDFRKASINGVSYGVGITEIGKASWKLQGKDIPQEMLDGEAQAKARAVPHVSFYCPTYEKDKAQGGAQLDKINRFFKILAICHDVIPEKIDGLVKLSASNPDDEALVCAAAYFGYEFCDRRDRMCVYFNKELGSNEEVELLESIDFSSKRKRMSVIIRDSDGRVQILTKGADTVMLERFKAGQDELMRKTDDDMRAFAVEGLRCLLIGCADIGEDKFIGWRRRYRAATSDLDEIEKMKHGEPNCIEELQDEIERGLLLIGATAIEDRLQDGVPECIYELAKAGIKIWVLTGDKEVSYAHTLFKTQNLIQIYIRRRLSTLQLHATWCCLLSTWCR
jgi:phospholipid-transporting ATPase